VLSTEDEAVAAARAYSDSIAPGAADRDRAGVAPRARERLFADVLADQRIGNGLAERGTKHAQDLQTRLTRSGDGRLRLNGRKYYCTGALTADWIAITALDDDEQLVAAFVRREAERVAVDEDWNVIDQRATASGTTTLKDVVVDDEMVLPWGEAFAAPQQLGARAQLYHAAIEVGIAGAALGRP
jgi:alkylation response protein AidB-like acyl-CoA dehydrogenase